MKEREGTEKGGRKGEVASVHLPHLHCLDIATLDNVNLERDSRRHLSSSLLPNTPSKDIKPSARLTVLHERMCVLYFIMTRGGVRRLVLLQRERGVKRFTLPS